jgi:integrase
MRLTLRTSSSLRPQELSEISQRAVNEFLREGQSSNTLASYRGALRYWAGWFAMRYGVQMALPVPPAAVLQFIIDHAQRTTNDGLVHELPVELDVALVDAGIKGNPGPLALGTIVHRIAVLSKAHQLRELENPCQDPKVRELLAMTRRAYAKRGVRPQKKDALTRDPLQALLATCDDSLRGKRDRALLLFAWSTGGRRRSEVTTADMTLLKPAGSGEYVYTLTHSKTNQTGVDRPEDVKPIVGPAAQALKDWLLQAGITHGRIFRRVLKGSRLGGPMTPASVRRIVLLRCQMAGMDGDYSAHSLRSGFVTEASKQNMLMSDVMALTGHRSVQSVLGYTRSEAQAASLRRLLAG